MAICYKRESYFKLHEWHSSLSPRCMCSCLRHNLRHECHLSWLTFTRIQSAQLAKDLEDKIRRANTWKLRWIWAIHVDSWHFPRVWTADEMRCMARQNLGWRFRWNKKMAVSYCYVHQPQCSKTGHIVTYTKMSLFCPDVIPIDMEMCKREEASRHHHLWNLKCEKHMFCPQYGFHKGYVTLPTTAPCTTRQVDTARPLVGNTFFVQLVLCSDPTCTDL